MSRTAIGLFERVSGLDAFDDEEDSRKKVGTLLLSDGNKSKEFRRETIC